MTEETPSAYLVWWNENHDWDFTGEGLYETHAKKCFSAGYTIAATETDALRAEVTALSVIYAESKRNNDELWDKIASLITDKNKDALEYCELMDKYDAAQVWTVQLREALEEVIFARHNGDEK